MPIFIALLLFAIITLIGCSVIGVTSASFSSDSKHIVFSYLENGSEQIYRMNADGSGVVSLTKDTETNYSEPRYSPDGLKIIFIEQKKKDSKTLPGVNISLMNADGSNMQTLTTGSNYDFSPVFFPNGKQILFLRSTRFGHSSPIAQSHYHSYDIYMMNIDGSELKRITNWEAFQITSPSITSDGKEVVLQIFEPGLSSLCKIPINNPETKLYIKPDLEQYWTDKKLRYGGKEPTGPIKYDDLYNPQLFPNDKYLVFTWPMNYRGYGYELYLMDIKTMQTKKLTDLRKTISEPSISSDGKKILFILEDDNNKKEKKTLWQIDSDGANLKQITFNIK
jgi:TolB protein